MNVRPNLLVIVVILLIRTPIFAQSDITFQLKWDGDIKRNLISSTIPYLEIIKSENPVFIVTINPDGSISNAQQQDDSKVYPNLSRAIKAWKFSPLAPEETQENQKIEVSFNYNPKDNDSESKEDEVFLVVDKMPTLIGGLGDLQRKVKYPEMARRAGIKGRVTVRFIVNEDGNVENAQVIKGIGGGCDEAALEAIRQAKFTPGMSRGKAVRVKYTLPIIF